MLAAECCCHLTVRHKTHLDTTALPAIFDTMSRREESKGGEDRFERACAEKTERISQKNAHTFMICVDGSDQSDVAFHAAMNLRRKYDHMCVFHGYKGEVFLSLCSV